MLRFLPYAALFAVCCSAGAQAADGPVGVSAAARAKAPLFRAVESTIQEGSRFDRFAQVDASDAGSFDISEDGTRYLLVRLLSPGSNAVRVHLRNLRLPAGARLWVYGVHGQDVMEVAGPYSGITPDGGSDFRTAAVSGSEVVLELQADGELPSELPFEIVGVSSADEATPKAPAKGPRATGTGFLHGAAVPWEANEEGLAVTEGDMVLGTVEDVARMTEPAPRKAGASKSALGIVGSTYRWPGAVLYYAVDSSIPTPARITDAVAHWNASLAGIVQIVARTTQTDYVMFTRATDSGNCSSYVGRMGGAQTLWVGDNCSTGNMIHEIGHAFGLFHEHTRNDQDTYVAVNYANIITTATANFDKVGTAGTSINSYDYGSIMHYAAYAFSANGLPTITTIPAGIAIGQRDGLSSGDLGGIKTLYPANPPGSGNVSVSIGTNPASLPFTTDGKQYTATTTFTWLSGSTHSVGAVNPTPVSGTRYLFASWSDGGPQTHVVTTPTSALTLRANYTTSYSLTTSVSGSGTLTVSPLSADTYYAANSTIALTAAPAAGACFKGWTGLLAGTPPKTSVTMTKAYAISAGFQAGSVSTSTTSMAFTGAGGSSNLSISATSGCQWNLSSSASWLTVGSLWSNKTMTVKVTAAPNTGVARSATLNLNGKLITVTQAAPTTTTKGR